MIKDTLLSLWNDLVFYVTLQFVDPGWWWLAVVIIACVAIAVFEIAVKFYFADIPWLKKVGGFATLGMIIFILSYWKGEKDARAHDAARKPKPKPAVENGQQPWKMPWEQ